MSEITRSGFTKRFVLSNDLDANGFKEWSFQPGMVFASREKWWGEHGARHRHHEGVDFAAFLDGEEREQQITAGMLVPTLFSGQVVNIIEDLLGSTIIIDHAIRDQDGRVLHAFYAHLTPHRTISQGTEIDSEDILGAIAPGSSCLAHLHISTAWCSRDIPLSNFSWQTSTLQFFNPMEII
jgi:murein DD-endopeptidase MepM/ murein hydrolase activator NlpD